MKIFGCEIKINNLFKPNVWMMVSELEDEWHVVRAGEITVAQGYKCRQCGLIYGNIKNKHICKYDKK